MNVMNKGNSSPTFSLITTKLRYRAKNSSFNEQIFLISLDTRLTATSHKGRDVGKCAHPPVLKS